MKEVDGYNPMVEIGDEMIFTDEWMNRRAALRPGGEKKNLVLLP